MAAAAAAVPGSAGSDVMFWWNTALGGSPRTFPAAMRRSAEASANFTKSKWGSGSSSRRSGRGARGGGGPTVAFSPFEVAYSVSTNSDPVVYLSTPPVYQNPNVTQNFASLVPLRKLGPLIVPIGVGGNPPCNADTNQTCLADLVGFLTSPARRAAAVAELVRVARSKGFAGWNFDQETQMQSKSAALTAGWRAFLAELAAAMKAHVDPAATVSVDICGNCGGSDYMGMFAGNWTGIGLEIVSMCGRIRTSAPPTINTRPVPRAERTTRSTQGSPAYPSPTAKRQPVLGLVRGFRRGIRMLASCVASCDWLRERT